MTEKLKEERAEAKRFINEIFEANPRGNFSREAIAQYRELLDRVNEIDILLSVRKVPSIEIGFEDLFLIDSIKIGEREVKVI